MNPYARNPAARQPMPQTAGGMGPYSPRVQATQIKPRQAPQQAAPAKSEGGMLEGLMGGGGGGMLGGMMGGLSDERSKKEIARLEGQNEALTAALDSSFNSSNMPETEYPKLPGNTRVTPSSSASFAETNDAANSAFAADAASYAAAANTPAANMVAAQNVALQQAAPQAAPPPPQAPGGKPFIQTQQPNLSELDEAFRRYGANQGT